MRKEIVEGLCLVAAVVFLVVVGKLFFNSFNEEMAKQREGNKCVKVLISHGVERKDIAVEWHDGKPVCVVDEDIYYRK